MGTIIYVSQIDDFERLSLERLIKTAEVLENSKQLIAENEKVLASLEQITKGSN